MTDIIANFLSHYTREFDFFEEAARVAEKRLQSKFENAGIKAIVSSRAKNPSRLAAKLETKKFDCVDDIYQKIVDLVGVRIALYFPGQGDVAGELIKESFDVHEIRSFPKNANTSDTSEAYKKRFSGYHAKHYRCRLKEDVVDESKQKYRVNVEIQVGSLLMHAWSEVEHDMVYKPLGGELSQEEHQILDELNGLVLSGELALERLQDAGARRAVDGFRDHFELASFLLSKEQEQGLRTGAAILNGNAFEIYQIMNREKRARPRDLERYIANIKAGLEDDGLSLSGKILDQLLAEDPGRLKVLEEIRKEPGADNSTRDLLIAAYLAQWWELEQLLPGQRPGEKSKTLTALNDGKFVNEFLDYRFLRNLLVHGEYGRVAQDVERTTNALKLFIPEVRAALKDS